MAEPVRARRLSDHEGQALQRLVRRGRHDSIRVRRALTIMASASGTPVAAIAQLVAADEDTVRDVIHAFNDRGPSALARPDQTITSIARDLGISRETLRVWVRAAQAGEGAPRASGLVVGWGYPLAWSGRDQR